MKQDYLDVLWALREHHTLFAQFWTVGHLTETTSIPRAAISWDKEGRGLQFLINPEYWATCNKHDKAFIISHECLHVYLEHGQRSIGLDRQKANIAQDIVINHLLVDNFQFDRKQLTDGEKYCWIDTCFPDRDDIETERSFEYYYMLLEDKDEDDPDTPRTVDSHDFLEDIDPAVQDAIDKIVEDMSNSMTPDEMENFEEEVSNGVKEEFDKAKQAGSTPGEFKKKIRLGRVVKKRKWETVVADVLGRFAGMEREMDIELWTRDPRRSCSLDLNLILPASVDETVIVRDKIDVWFFQDVSGSCIEYAERFFKAASSIPDDRFRLRGFCFDTRVHEVDMKKGEIKGGGGTRFQPMEDKIHEMISKEGCKYPQAIFVITDGEDWGSMTVQEASRWHFFLTAGGTTRALPDGSNNYSLSDYE